jgi:hypothetical protein
MGDQKFPLKQGDLDFLCGVYAAINAMHLRGEVNELDQAAVPFRLALMCMQSNQQWDLAQAVCFGIDEDDYHELLAQISWREWDYIKDPTEKQLSNALAELNSKTCDSFIISILAKDTEVRGKNTRRNVLHYTVVKKPHQKPFLFTTVRMLV